MVRPGEGPWQHGLEHGRVRPDPTGPACAVTSYQIATVERRAGAPARKGRRGAFAEGAPGDLRRSGAPLPHVGEGGPSLLRGRRKEGRRWPRAKWKGPMNHACIKVRATPGRDTGPRASLLSMMTAKQV